MIYNKENCTIVLDYYSEFNSSLNIYVQEKS